MSEEEGRDRALRELWRVELRRVEDVLTTKIAILERKLQAHAHKKALQAHGNAPAPRVLGSEGQRWLARASERSYERTDVLLGEIVRILAGRADAAMLTRVYALVKAEERARDADMAEWLDEMTAGRDEAGEKKPPPSAEPPSAPLPPSEGEAT